MFFKNIEKWFNHKWEYEILGNDNSKETLEQIEKYAHSQTPMETTF